MRGLDTRVYYNWSLMSNKSTEMSFNPTAGNAGAGVNNCNTSATGCNNELYGYQRNNFGVEVGYRLNPTNKIAALYDYMHSNQNRPDYDRTVTSRYGLEWKNSSFDQVDTRLKYQYMVRNSGITSEWGSQAGPAAWSTPFDLASVVQNLVKGVVDWAPAPLWNVGAEVLYKHNDYTQAWGTYGRQKDQRQELFLTAGYGDRGSLRFSVYGDAEYVNYDSLHRVGNLAPFAPGSPALGATSGAPVYSSGYSWTAKDREHNYLLGAGMDWVPANRLAVNSSLSWMKTHGTSDFASNANLLPPQGLLAINNWGNSTTWLFNTKATYAYDKNWDITGGYAYQHYSYSDIAADGYRYTVGTAGTGMSFATGQYAFPQNTANTIYAFVKYKF